MFCGMPSGGRGMLGLSSVGRQPCSSPCLPALCDPLLDVADRIEILVELALVGRADLPAQVAGVGQHGVEHALVAPLHFVFEQPVEGQGRIELQRRGRGRRRPGNVRAVEHRVVLVDRRVRLLAAQHQARHLGRAAVRLREQLIDAGARANLAAGGERRAGEQVARLRAVDVPLERLLVVQAADEQQLLAEVGQRREHLAQLHRLAFALGPPFLAVKAVAGEQHGQPHRRFARTVRCRAATSPQTLSDSSHGSAIVTPRPRSIVRREKRWEVMVLIPSNIPVDLRLIPDRCHRKDRARSGRRETLPRAPQCRGSELPA